MILSVEKQIYDTNQKPIKVTHETAVEALHDAATAQETADTAQTTAENAQAAASAAASAAALAESTATEALNKHGFCSCTTAAGTAAKTASLTGFQLQAGSTVHVTFTNANTVANPTLNINDTGAKPIKWNNAAVAASPSPWAAGECVAFVYDGTNWVISGQSNITADNIVSGSITADRIKANVISAVNGGTGSINADKIQANVITAVNNGTGTINADKINVSGITIGQSQVTGLTTALNGKETAGAAAAALANANSYTDTAASNAAKTATNYITNISGGGITVTGNSATADVKVTDKVRVQADGTHFTDVESTGMKVYSGSASVPVAQFLATGSRVSYDATHYTEFAANSWTICGGTNSPTIKASTYPNTATEATTGLAGLTISNSARTKQLIQLFTYKRTYTGSNPESANITLHAYDTGNEVIGLKTSRLNDGSTAGGGIYIQGLGTTNTAVDMMSSIGNLNGTQRAGGLIRVHYGTAAVSLAAQLRTFGQNSAPSLEFYNTSGTQQSWYGARKAYIKGAYDEGAVVHGHTSTYEMSLDCDLSSGYVAFYGNGTAIGSIPVGSSDRRTKADIEPIQDKYKRAALKVELKDFHYDFNDEVLSGVNKLMRFGVIAQDVIEALDSEGVQEGESEFIGTLSDENSERYIVNYVPFLIARLAADEDRIKELETRLEALERRL